MERKTTETFWPTEFQREILAVAFASPASAAERWLRLQHRFVLDEIEPGVYALLPLVYRKLVTAGYDDDVMPRLKGIFKKTWVTNTLALEHCSQMAEALRLAGIPALFVEGPALAKRFYAELGLRPTSYLDVLVDGDTTDGAVDVLADLGWRSEYAGWSPEDESVLVTDDGHRCVVRTSLSTDFTGPSGRRHAMAPLWENAERLEVADAELLVPSSTDCLVGVCVAHARVRSASGPQWIADATMLLETEIDWSRLIEVSAGGGQILRLRRSLGYLADLAPHEPPLDALEQLWRQPVSLRERLLYKCTTGGFRSTGSFPLLVAEHLARTTDRSLVRAGASFPAHVRDRWGLARTRHVPFAALRRALRRLSARGRVAH